MEPNLFSSVIDLDEPQTGFALWFRPSGTKRKWIRVATAPTTYELLTHMDQAGSGDFNMQPAGVDPNVKKAA
jgi:hypothetical protein